MAAGAVIVCIFEDLGLMAFAAFTIAVLTEQREPCEVVVKEWPVQPLRLVVAIAAHFTQLPFMGVIVQMA